MIVNIRANNSDREADDYLSSVALACAGHLPPSESPVDDGHGARQQMPARAADKPGGALVPSQEPLREHLLLINHRGGLPHLWQPSSWPIGSTACEGPRHCHGRRSAQPAEVERLGSRRTVAKEEKEVIREATDPAACAWEDYRNHRMKGVSRSAFFFFFPKCPNFLTFVIREDGDSNSKRRQWRGLSGVGCA